MTTCEPLRHGGEDDLALISYAEASRASLSASPGRASRRRIAGGSGQPSRTSFATYDPATRSWRTFQDCLDGDSVTYSETWPPSGMTRNGTAFRRSSSVPPIYATESGLWPTPRPCSGERSSGANRTEFYRKFWPTPNATDYKGPSTRSPGKERPSSNDDLPTRVSRMLPTPTANCWDGLQSHGVNVVTGQLNPTWVEWLMGYPAGWTDCEDSATPSSPRSPSTSDG